MHSGKLKGVAAAVVALLFGLQVAKAAEEPLLEPQLIFSYDYLLNHAPCVVECPNGDLLACWNRGSGVRLDDVRADDAAIMGARLRKDSAEWSEPFLMADAPAFPDLNPCMVIDPRRKLWLFWQTIIANDWHTGLCRFHIASQYTAEGPPVWERSDNLILKPGAEFIESVVKKCDEDLARVGELREELRERTTELLTRRRKDAADKYFNRMGWMTRAHPIFLDEKRLLVPLYSDGFRCSMMALSEDWGQTWTPSQPLVSYGGVAPSVARRKDGSLIAYMRDNGPPPKRILQSESKDEGRTWSPVAYSEMPNSASPPEVIRLSNGHLLLINNDTEQGRHSLLVSISEDDGRTWKWNRHLETNDPDTGPATAQYPSVIEGRDGTLHAVYSYWIAGVAAAVDAQGRRLITSIKHAHFNEAWVVQGDQAGN